MPPEGSPYTDEDRATVDRIAEDLGVLEKALRSRRYTVQCMPDPPRYEIIYAGKPPHYNDERCGTLERTIELAPTQDVDHLRLYRLAARELSMDERPAFVKNAVDVVLEALPGTRVIHVKCPQCHRGLLEASGLANLAPRPTTYTVNLTADMHDWIEVVLTCLAGQGPHKPPHDTWAVRRLSYCLNADDEWELEPIPSSRDDEFLARTRWPLEEALERAQEAADELKLQQEQAQ